MLTRQVLESQRKQTQRQSQSWSVNFHPDKLWLWASAWLKQRVALPEPAPSLRHPGWLSGQLDWTGPRPWLEVPFTWQFGHFFCVEHCGGPRSYLRWQIQCEPTGPQHARLTLQCDWQWSKHQLFQQRWNALCQDLTQKLKAFETLQQHYPVHNLEALKTSARALDSLFHHLEPGLVASFTGAETPAIWSLFQEWVHEKHWQSHWFEHLPGGRVRRLAAWPESLQSEALHLVLCAPERDLSDVLTPPQGLKHQQPLWPKYPTSLSLRSSHPLPWRGNSLKTFFLAPDPLAPHKKRHPLPDDAHKKYHYLHPQGTQSFFNTAAAPLPLSYGEPRFQARTLQDLFTDPGATPYLFGHWPENHPLEMNLCLCLVSTAAPHQLAPGMAGVIENSLLPLQQGRLLLSSAQGILLAFAQAADALRWLQHHLYPQLERWERWGLLSEGFIPQIALNEGQVKIYPQQGLWRVMGNSVRHLNQQVDESQGAVVMSAQCFAQPVVQAFCKQNQWQTCYLPQTRQVHLLPRSMATTAP